MFSSFLRRNKQEKQTEPPKLRGMPALKQMRSSKREVSLTTKPSPVLSNLSEIDRLRILGNEEVKHHAIVTSHPSAQTKQDKRSPEPMNITKNYKRTKSPETSDRKQSNHVDRVSNNSNRTSAVFNEEESTRFDGSIPEVDEDCIEESDATNNPSWRMSKGDSGYKSKDESRKSSSSDKRPHRKKSNFNKPLATTGLHVVKQQRKASRDSVSQSMRALTPKERESIRCLDEVLENHPDGEESLDEVFESESSENDIEEENEVSYKEYEMDEPDDETVDYGYSSVNDISRKYSLESLESVGSIIDLVGNLSASSSSQASHGVTGDDYVTNDDVTNTAYVDKYNYENYSTVSTIQNVPDDVAMDPDDAIFHLDEVIHSFSIDSEQEVIDVDDSKIVDQRNKSRDSTIDLEKEKKKREKRKSKDPEKERERKEKRKKKKEEKRAKREQEDSNTRNQNITKQVDEISALTQDMMNTSQQNSQEEAVYAQVDYSKKKKKTEKTTTKDANDNFETFPDPPSPFSNRPSDEQQEPTSKSSRAFWSQIDKQSLSQHTEPNFNYTSTPGASPDTVWKSTRNSSSDATYSSVQTPKRPVSDASEYKSNYQPYISKNTPQSSSRIVVNSSMIQESTKGLKHVKAQKGKVFEVDPSKNQIKETTVVEQPKQEPNLNPPERIIKYLPKKDPVAIPRAKNEFHRKPKNEHFAPSRGRPISLNLDESGNLTTFKSSETRGTVVKPYSSFREDKNDITKRGSQVASKPKPFVITSTKKPIQLY